MADVNTIFVVISVPLQKLLDPNTIFSLDFIRKDTLEKLFIIYIYMKFILLTVNYNYREPAP